MGCGSSSPAEAPTLSRPEPIVIEDIERTGSASSAASSAQGSARGGHHGPRSNHTASSGGAKTPYLNALKDVTSAEVPSRSKLLVYSRFICPKSCMLLT
jgi:hypothetical protein